MEIFKHILEREIIHLFSSPGVYLMMLLGSWYLKRKWEWWRYHCPQGWFAYIIPAIVPFAFIFLQEVHDLTKIPPDPGYKSIIDATIWMTGLVISIIGVYRMTPELYAIERFIAEKRAARKLSQKP